jgi:hypothetical protein
MPGARQIVKRLYTGPFRPNLRPMATVCPHSKELVSWISRVV